MREALVSSGRERKPAKVLEHLRVTPAENGGAVVEHHFTSYEHKPETHVFGADEADKMAAHVVKFAGMKSAPEAEDETGGGIADKKGGGAEADREM